MEHRFREKEVPQDLVGQHLSVPPDHRVRASLYKDAFTGAYSEPGVAYARRWRASVVRNIYQSNFECLPGSPRTRAVPEFPEQGLESGIDAAGQNTPALSKDHPVAKRRTPHEPPIPIGSVRPASTRYSTR